MLLLTNNVFQVNLLVASNVVDDDDVCGWANDAKLRLNTDNDGGGGGGNIDWPPFIFYQVDQKNQFKNLKYRFIWSMFNNNNNKNSKTFTKQTFRLKSGEKIKLNSSTKSTKQQV